MITPDLVRYIKSQLNKNIPRNEIIKNLAKVGWRIEDIEEGFSKINDEANPEPNNLTQNTPIQTVQKKIDPYRESFDDDLGISTNVEKVEKVEPTALESLKIWSPTNVKPAEVEPEIKPEVKSDTTPEVKTEIKPEITPKIEPKINFGVISREKPEVKIETKPVEEKPVLTHDIEPYKFEMPGEVKVAPIIPIKPAPLKIEEPKVEVPKVETPKVENITPAQSPKVEISAGPSLELPKIEAELPKQEVHEFMPTINKDPVVSTQSPSPVQSPISIPVSSMPINPTPTVSQGASFGGVKIPQTKIPSIPNGVSGLTSKNAMLSSYSQDILNTNKDSNGVSKGKGKSFLKWAVAIIILIILGGMVFAFVEGYLKIPGLNFSFALVKKDPKTVILNAGDKIAKLNSYKVSNAVSVTFPALSSITTGLSSGEVVNSKDVDSISFNSKGAVNNSNNNTSFDYDIRLKSSLLQNEITSNLKYNGSNLTIDIPDLSQLAGDLAPAPATVSMDPNEIGKVIPELSSSMQSKIKAVDIYDISSKGVPMYVKNEMSSIFKTFVNSLSYTEKESEIVNGVEVYHYELIADRASTKKFLSGISDLFIMNLSSEEKNSLDEAIGASTFKSMEIWIGKNDDNIYKFKFDLSAPLSKVLGFNDSGIGNNQVDLQWTTTFSDINVANNISMPDNTITMDQFIKGIRDIKIKNIISKFKPQASMLKNAVGGFGNRTNPGGNCANPNPGSLFSPLGHSKGATTAVGAISNSMTNLLSATDGGALCFSTPASWALSAPLYTTVASSDGSSAVSYFCADNTGNVITLPLPIKEAACK